MAKKVSREFKIAVDFDGTIVEHMFPHIGPTCGEVFRWLKRYQELGAKLILWTVRSDGDKGPVLTEAIEFCRQNGVEFHSVNESKGQHYWSSSPKAYAQLYIDDANLYCPLCPANNYTDARPYADWRVIGPAVERIVMQHLGVPEMSPTPVVTPPPHFGSV